jgi:membrane fusion protein, multidrug efflux system
VRVVLTVEPEAVVVPEVAVQPGQAGPFVYLVDAEGKVEVRQVKVSRQLGNEVVIGEGLKAGDHVITEIPQALRPGATVRLADGTGSGGEKRKGKGGKKGEGKGKGKAAEGETAKPAATSR